MAREMKNVYFSENYSKKGSVRKKSEMIRIISFKESIS